MEGVMLKLVWLHLACLRFMLCLSPQYGYIYPDEFFQSPEIMAGDVFGFSHVRTWEWHKSNPARSIVFPIVSSGVPFLFLKHLSNYFDFTITSHVLLLAPRLWMTLLSLVTDIMIYKVADKLFFDKDIANLASIIFASSYTSWVYATRTFSNVFELILLAILLHLVTSYPSNSVLAKKSQSKKPPEKDSSKKTLSEDNKVKENDTRRRRLPTQQSSTSPIVISAVIVAGCFVRISFPAFAIMPLLYWSFKGAKSDRILISVQLAVYRLLSLLPGAFIFTCLFILIDCSYFNHEKILQLPLLVQESNFSRLFDWCKGLAITPLNNLLYNVDSSKLQTHGLHPWYLHMAVNLPLLFGPLLYPFLKVVRDRSRYLNNASYIGNRSIFNLLTCTYACGLITLSLVPHQEPRFILPLAIPIAVLSAKHLQPLSSTKFLCFIWIVFNLCGFVLFGLFHQGGVVPSMGYVNSLAKVHRQKIMGPESSVKVFYYKTYMPPVHLAALDENKDKSFKIIDLGDSAHSKLEDALHTSLRDPNAQVYLVLPGSIPCVQYRKLRQGYQLELQFQVFPHLSMEVPPWGNTVCMSSRRNEFNIFLEMFDRMIITIYKIDALQASKSNTVNYAMYTASKVETSTM